MVHVVLAFALAAVATLAVSLPADWAWRRGTGPVTAAATVFNVVAIIAIIYIVGLLGLLDGAGAVAALVLGIIAGGLVGNWWATRLWGRPRFQR